MRNAIAVAALVFAIAPAHAQYYGQRQPQQPQYGSHFDARSGNQYNWNRDAMGNTNVRGMNIQNGTSWSQTIDREGNQRGIDSNFNSWQYNRNSGTYINYGTGTICTGTGYARVCN